MRAVGASNAASPDKACARSPRSRGPSAPPGIARYVGQKNVPIRPRWPAAGSTLRDRYVALVVRFARLSAVSVSGCRSRRPTRSAGGRGPGPERLGPGPTPPNARRGSIGRGREGPNPRHGPGQPRCTHDDRPASPSQARTTQDGPIDRLTFPPRAFGGFRGSRSVGWLPVERGSPSLRGSPLSPSSPSSRGSPSSGARGLRRGVLQLPDRLRGTPQRPSPAAPIRRDRRSRKMIVWPVIRSSRITPNSRAALTSVRPPPHHAEWRQHDEHASTMSWNRKQPSPGPRSASSSWPLYWIGPVGRGGRGGVGSAVGSVSVTSGNDTE